LKKILQTVLMLVQVVLQQKARNQALAVAQAVQAILKKVRRRASQLLLLKVEMRQKKTRVEIRREKRARIALGQALHHLDQRRRKRKQKRKMPKFKSRNPRALPAAHLALVALDPRVKIKIKRRKSQLVRREKHPEKREDQQRREKARMEKKEVNLHLHLVAAHQAVVMVLVQVQAQALQAVKKKFAEIANKSIFLVSAVDLLITTLMMKSFFSVAKLLRINRQERLVKMS